MKVQDFTKEFLHIAFLFTPSRVHQRVYAASFFNHEGSRSSLKSLHINLLFKPSCKLHQRVFTHPPRVPLVGACAARPVSAGSLPGDASAILYADSGTTLSPAKDV